MPRKLYDFKDHPAHRAHLEPWAKRWIANAMSTQAMTDEGREICRHAILRSKFQETKRRLLAEEADARAGAEGNGQQNRDHTDSPFS